MKRSFKILNVKGISIEVNTSWIFAFVLMTYSIASGYLPNVSEDSGVVLRWGLGALMVILLFSSVVLHELAHSLVSIRQGIPVKRIKVFIFGGIAEIEKEPEKPGDELKIAIAGPVLSFVLFLFFLGCTFLMTLLGASQIVLIPLAYLSSANLILSLFNLIPAFPLDGGRILRALIWKFSGDCRKATRIASNTGTFFGYLMIFYGMYIALGGYVLNGIWLIFIGWFISRESQSSYDAKIIGDIFDRICVSEFMTEDIISVENNITIQEVIMGYFLKYKFAVFPVVTDGIVTGIITADTVRKIEPEVRGRLRVAEVSIPLNDKFIVGPGDTVTVAMSKLSDNGIGRVLVMNDTGGVIGIVSHTDILSYLHIYTQMNQ